MILDGAQANAEDLARFRTEAEAVARLQHPNIVQIHEIGEHEGLPYFALEYVEGGSLDKQLAGRPRPARAAAELIETLARAIAFTHQHGIIHRDLKPANVLLTAGGTPKIADFGLAKRLDEVGQTQTGSVMGTPSYMAPEQALCSKNVGPAADVYALGAILYECLTGRPPFKAATVMETVRQVVSQEPVPPSRLVAGLPRDLETICLKCLHKEPLRRYAARWTWARTCAASSPANRSWPVRWAWPNGRRNGLSAGPRRPACSPSASSSWPSSVPAGWRTGGPTSA